MTTTTESRPVLTRPASGRMIGGVCAGIARRFGWNVAVVRVLTVASVFIPGPQVIIYIAMWALIPADSRQA
ncbi:PspC domain-containing protein [Glaciihabitans arcticus]|uniref:PspC domain-containing protein n=1 Tax=Glaciihabitans arcticus TaxID=2668039 RepID=A0A4Q9GWV2_9MICO|nr:PspC domain-containing protein [Glaciihabitans arcticus]TBN57183.1 PspC domain-containing protein [Glaciihabitans arcticus]